MKKRNIILIVSAVILFIFLAIAINVDYFRGFESWVYNGATKYMTDLFTVILKCITHIGGPIGVATICLAILIIPKLRDKLFIPVSTAVSSALVLNIVLKRIFSRERPNILRLVSESYYSFPSGHAMVNMALYCIIMIYTHKFVQSKKIRIFNYIFFSLLIFAIGFSRIYLGVHYAGDILGGWAAGFAVSILVYMILNNKKVNEIVEEK